MNSSDYAQRLEKWNHQRRSIFLKGSLVYIILNGRHYGPNHLLGMYLSACMFAAHACLTNFLLSSHPRTQPAKTRKKMPILGNLNFFAFKKGQREILFWCCESTWLFSDFKFLLIYFFCHIVHNLMMLSTKGEIVMEKLFLTIICLIS